MKIRTHRLAWAVFLLFAGAFLLLNNLKVFREFGDGIWGGLFAVVGFGFLIWFLIQYQLFHLCELMFQGSLSCQLTVFLRIQSFHVKSLQPT